MIKNKVFEKPVNKTKEKKKERKNNRIIFSADQLKDEVRNGQEKIEDC